MPPATPTRPPKQPPGFRQMLAWAVGLVGGGTALFYGLGYTIVNTYIRRVGLEGMFDVEDTPGRRDLWASDLRCEQAG